MSPVRITFKRTVASIYGLYSTALAVCGFMAAAAVLFAFNLIKAEGSTTSLATIWCMSVAPLLPVLAALLSMDVWSEDRRTGRIQSILSIAVKERDFVLGKFFGALFAVILSLALFLVVSLGVLRFYSPTIFYGQWAIGFIPGILILFLQCSLWCASCVGASALFGHAAASAAFSIALLVALPRGIWIALGMLSIRGREAFGIMPLDAHVYDFSVGVISTGILISYVTLTLAFLYVAAKLVAMLRLKGLGARSLKFSSVTVIVLAFVFSALVSTSALRLDATFDLPVDGASHRFSVRTRKILADASGEINVTCFLGRNDQNFRFVAHILRMLQREAKASGGVSLNVRYVDPKWDFGNAERLIRRGIKPGTIVFEKGHRLAQVAVDAAFGERVCAHTIQRIVNPPQRNVIYWTVGHGESSIDAYGDFGLSDIARDLSREGYINKSLDLTGDNPIPSDCALMVVAGAKDDFSRAELALVNSFLAKDGRLLVLANNSSQGGVVSLLPQWGIKPLKASMAGLKTLSGSDIIVSEFAEHPISSPLIGSRILLEKPVAFSAGAVAEGITGADKIKYHPLASAAGSAFAAVVERGGGVGVDLAIRPTRIVAVGDATFVMNFQLAARASANRDFFLNCVAFLSGTDAISASGRESNIFISRLDRKLRRRFVRATAIISPVVVFVLMIALAAWRRRRG